MNAPFSYMTPDAPQVVTFASAIRRLIAEAIESLILLLDEIGGDVEMEDGDPADEGWDAEPSLGAFELMNQGGGVAHDRKRRGAGSGARRRG
jgi:hypothetical protein